MTTSFNDVGIPLWLALATGVFLGSMYCVGVDYWERTNPAKVLELDTRRYHVPLAIVAGVAAYTAAKVYYIGQWPQPLTLALWGLTCVGLLCLYRFPVIPLIVVAVLAGGVVYFVPALLPYLLPVAGCCALEAARAGLRASIRYKGRGASTPANTHNTDPVAKWLLGEI